MKLAALPLGALALVQGNTISIAANSIVGQEATTAVLTAFNLIRTGKIDGGLLPLIPIEKFELDTAMTEAIEKGLSDLQCWEKPSAWQKDLIISLKEGLAAKSYNDYLDEVVSKQLPELRRDNGTVKQGTAPLGHIIDPKAFKVGCGVTTNCILKTSREAIGQNQWLFCQFQDVSGNPITTAGAIDPAFLDAMQARLDAGHTLKTMKATDLGTRLTSGVSKAAVSVLSLIAVAVPALML